MQRQLGEGNKILGSSSPKIIKRSELLERSKMREMLQPKQDVPSKYANSRMLRPMEAPTYAYKKLRLIERGEK